MRRCILPVKSEGWHIVLAGVGLLLVMGACDPQVDRFEENDLHYSLFGYLDASADTQFVRVEPLRDGLQTRVPRTLGAEVTLTNLATDRSISLQDSLFRYQENATAHNFYTTVEIEPNTPYRLRVRGPGEAESWAQTTVPDSFPAPYQVVPLEAFDPECTDQGPRGASVVRLVIPGIGRLVAVKSLFTTRYGGVSDFNHLSDTTYVQGGQLRARINLAEDYCEIPPRLREVSKIQIVVAAGDPNWPDFLALDWEAEVLPSAATNVNGGVGYVGGVVSDTLVVFES